MTQEFEREVHIEKDAATVWGVVSNPGAIRSWMPNVAECSVDGATRIARLSNGAVLTERFLADPDSRTFEYTITQAPFPVAEHRGRLAVEPEGPGTRVRYQTRIAPVVLADSFAQGMEAALDGLRAYLER